MPRLTVQDMHAAFEMAANDDSSAANGSVVALLRGRESWDANYEYDASSYDEAEPSTEVQALFGDEFVEHSTPEARSQITRLQFSSYQFEELPREVVVRAYENLQHVDIRQNGRFRCRVAVGVCV